MAALQILVGEDGEDREEMYRKLQLIREEYDEKLEFEPRFWSKAWIRVKKHGKVALTWIASELKEIWERGGREVIVFGALGGLAMWLIPGAGPVIAAFAPLVLLRILNRAFNME